MLGFESKTSPTDLHLEDLLGPWGFEGCEAYLVEVGHSDRPLEVTPLLLLVHVYLLPVL